VSGFHIIINDKEYEAAGTLVLTPVESPKQPPPKRIVLFHESWNWDPWDANGLHVRDCFVRVDNIGRLGQLPENWNSYELSADRNSHELSWSGTSGRMVGHYVLLDAPQPIAAAFPEGTLSIEVVSLNNCGFRIQFGRVHELTVGLHEISTDYKYEDKVGKYSTVGDFWFASYPIDSSKEFSGVVRFKSYEITALDTNSQLAAVADRINSSESRGGHGYVTYDAAATEVIEVSGVKGEPISFALDVRGTIPVVVEYNLGTFTAKARWISKRGFLLNNPALDGSDELFDVREPIARREGKAWISFILTESAEGEICLKVGGQTLRRIPLQVTVHNIELNPPLVKPGIYVVDKYYEGKWSMVHKWMERAGISRSTCPSVALEAIEAILANRKRYGLDESNPMLTGMLNYEMWRFVHGAAPDYHNLTGWIGCNVREKLHQAYDALDAEQIWLYSWDEAKGETLEALRPFWELGISLGAKWFAAIHSRYWENSDVRNAISFWIMTERNYIFNQRAREAGKLTGKYGYPFADVITYEVHREEFMKCLYSDVDFYFNYALNDIRGNPFDSNRKMCLIIPTENGLVETLASEGFIRAVWDQRYLATVEKVEAYGLHPGVDYNRMRELCLEELTR